MRRSHPAWRRVSGGERRGRACVFVRLVPRAMGASAAALLPWAMAVLAPGLVDVCVEGCWAIVVVVVVGVVEVMVGVGKCPCVPRVASYFLPPDTSWQLKPHFQNDF